MKIEIPFGTEIIVFTGPESSGKTTCAERMATENQLPLVEEYARKYLNEHGPEYTLADIKKMADHQIADEVRACKNGSLIICDTDVVTLEIWALEKFGVSLGIKDELIHKKHYLLCYPDVPWEPDPLRENPLDRERLFDLYYSFLQSLPVTFVVLEEKDRMNLILENE
jgi:nicotinamide riboside kinase